MTEAYIYDAIRSPRGKGRKDGSLHEVTSVRLSANVLNELATRNNLKTEALEDVIWGNVTQVMEQGGCLARSAVLLACRDCRSTVSVPPRWKRQTLAPIKCVVAQEAHM